MPITTKEVVMKNDTILVTRTDLKGIITFANDAFVEISGYTREELIGSSHNIVRHPDMPPAAFEDMWRNLKQNRPWQGLVKNRTKSGDFYWVNANAMPLYENDVVKGYLSVRLPPARADIEVADALYKKINAKQATLYPTGIKALCTTASELSLKTKLALVGIVFSILSGLLCYQYALMGAYDLIAFVVGLTLFGLFILAYVMSSTERFLHTAINELYKLSVNKPSQPLNLKREDLLGDLFRGVYVAGVKLGDDIAQAKQDSSNALRIVQGLKYVQSSVLIANANLEIIFVNKAADALFSAIETDVQTVIPNFNAKKLLGSHLDQFNVPSLQSEMLNKIDDTYVTEFDLGGHVIKLTIKPVLEAGQRIGFVSEWVDRTVEVKIEREIEYLVDEIRLGNLEKRIDIADKSGFMKSLSVNINGLTDVIENVFRDVNRIIAKLAEGDLTNGIDANYQGIYAECQENINNAMTKMSEFILQVRETAQFVNASSQEIVSGNNNLSHRVEQQAANLEETAASMQELTTIVQGNAENTEDAMTVVKSAMAVAKEGGHIVTSAISAMRAINDSSNRIADIISVIDDIAFQTNLLALNASVEAARAGEQGMGFSVVATEVRNLAQRSADAAKQISELIEGSVKEVRSGAQFVNETGNALTEIVNNIHKVSVIVDHIAVSSNEQSQGINQVNKAVTQIDDITQQNAELAQQAAAGSVAMSEQSSRLIEMLDFFKVEMNKRGGR